MAGQNAGWRPQIGGDIALRDEHLKRIGYAVAIEAHAKFVACTVLKVIEQLPHDQWVRLDRRPLKEICRRLLEGSAGIDADLTARLEALEAAR